MKKTVMAAALIAALTFTGIQTISAHGSKFYNDNNYGPGYCGAYSNDSCGYSEADEAVLRKFRDDTKAIRREITVKRSELNVLARKDNPDENKVAKLTGELYDLETDLDSKAEAAGIDNSFAYGRGPSMMRGYGRGCGGYMMGW